MKKENGRRNFFKTALASIFGGAALLVADKITKADEISYTCVFDPESESEPTKLIWIERLSSLHAHHDHNNHCHTVTSAHDNEPIGTVRAFVGDGIPMYWAIMDGSANSKEKGGSGIIMGKV